MKLIARPLTFLGFVLLVFSCKNMRQNDQNDTDNMNIESSTLSDRDNDGLSDEEDFVTDVIENHQREKTWLQAGINKGNDPEVKELARNLLQDHENIINELRDYAGRKNMDLDKADTSRAGVSSVVEDTEREIINIVENGREWDEEWADEIGDEHESLIRRYQRARNNIDDNDLENIIDRQLPGLRANLEKARKLEEKLDNRDNKK